jgi:hypothetical protein
MSETATVPALTPDDVVVVDGGGPQIEDELDPSSVIDTDGSHPFVESDEIGLTELDGEEGEEDEGEETPPASEESETPVEKTESPEEEGEPDEGKPENKFTLDGVEYENTQIQSALQIQTSLVEVEAGLKERGIENIQEAIRIAQTYSGLERQMSKPETAREVIEEMIQVATGVWGADFEVPASVDSLAIDPSNLTESERGLLAINARLNQQLAAQNLAYKESNDDLRTKIDALEARYTTDYSAIVKAAVPSSTATSEEIRRMMNDTGENDPVKAFKLASFDNPSGVKAQAKEKVDATPKKPVVVAAKGGKAKTYDSMATGMTADKIDWYDANGYIDIQDMKAKN